MFRLSVLAPVHGQPTTDPLTSPDRCRPDRQVQCSNGELGYGRRRRRAVTSAGDPNKVFQVEMSTILSVKFEDAQTEVEAGETRRPIRGFDAYNTTTTALGTLLS